MEPAFFYFFLEIDAPNRFGAPGGLAGRANLLISSRVRPETDWKLNRCLVKTSSQPVGIWMKTGEIETSQAMSGRIIGCVCEERQLSQGD